MKAWNALRSALLYIVLLATCMIWIWPIFFSSLLCSRLANAFQRNWSLVVLYCCRYICGIRFTITGQEHLQHTPAVFFVRHESAWETIALPRFLGYSCFVAKKSLFYIPFFGWGMYFSRHIPIDRSAGIKALKKVIGHGKDRIKRGISIVLFPEGTRMPVGQVGKFHKSGSMLAKSTNAPIIPIVHNAGMLWQKRSFIKQPGLVQVVIGPPIDTNKKSVEQINQEVYDWMSAQLALIEPSP